jgi:hypothetical protein
MLITSPEFTSNLTGKTYYTKSFEPTSITDYAQEINTHRSNNSKSSDRIILLNVNCRSLRSESKRQEFLALVDMYKPHIIHATETHLDKQISNAELIDPLLYDCVIVGLR